MSQRNVMFGAGLGAWNGEDASRAAEATQQAVQADRDGLDLFTVGDHPYLGEKLEAYALTGYLLGQTEHISGMVTVTNLPTRLAPILARTITTLSTLSGGRIMLGIGAGGQWDMIARLGVPRLDGGAAVRAMAEAITLIRALSGGGDPVTFDGEFYRVTELAPAEAPTPKIFTGSVLPKSLAVTGRLADGWIPPGSSDWHSQLYHESRVHIDEAATAAGRDPAEIAIIYNFSGRISLEPLAATRDEDGRWIGGSIGQWVDELTSAVLEHDAAGFIFRSTDSDTPAAVAQTSWATEIVPAVRAAIAK
jgi:alkanesulfonate monooxygenase SsuD/methylene tetrahydromethanopterin reductase-like flavin-dependent oxidoreductase (luciferase family)